VGLFEAARTPFLFLQRFFSRQCRLKNRLFYFFSQRR
jgi:hypothetical protein